MLPKSYLLPMKSLLLFLNITLFSFHVITAVIYALSHLSFSTSFRPFLTNHSNMPPFPHPRRAPSSPWAFETSVSRWAAGTQVRFQEPTQRFGTTCPSPEEQSLWAEVSPRERPSLPASLLPHLLFLLILLDSSKPPWKHVPGRHWTKENEAICGEAWTQPTAWSQAEERHSQPRDPWEKISVLLQAPESLKLIDMQQKRFQTND